MNTKILVVEDEEHIVELLKFNLEKEGYSVITADNGKMAVEKCENQIPDLVLLDLMIPEIDGYEVLKIIKSNNDTKEIPVIMVTAKATETDKVIGLEFGADDYITKPFSVRELQARVKAVLRRSKTNDKVESRIIKIKDIVIDIEKHEVTKNGNKIELTLKEFELLRILGTNRGKVLSRDMLLDDVWGYDYFGETRTVDVHIRHLRKKIEDENNYYIDTIRGIGYKMK